MLFIDCRGKSYVCLTLKKTALFRTGADAQSKHPSTLTQCAEEFCTLCQFSFVFSQCTSVTQSMLSELVLYLGEKKKHLQRGDSHDMISFHWLALLRPRWRATGNRPNLFSLFVCLMSQCSAPTLCGTLTLHSTFFLISICNRSDWRYMTGFMCLCLLPWWLTLSHWARPAHPASVTQCLAFF